MIWILCIALVLTNVAWLLASDRESIRQHKERRHLINDALSRNPPELVLREKLTNPPPAKEPHLVRPKPIGS